MNSQQKHWLSRLGTGLPRLCSLGAIIVTFVSLSSYGARHPYLEILSHFKLQYFLINAFLLFLLLLLTHS